MRYFPDVHFEVFKNENETILLLKEDLTFVFDDLVLIVPAGFISDGASVPKLFHDAYAPNLDSRTAAASFFHDYVYRTPSVNISRLKADWYYHKICTHDGLPYVKSLLGFGVLTLFGASNYKERSKS
jgi:hypothetical protein